MAETAPKFRLFNFTALLLALCSLFWLAGCEEKQVVQEKKLTVPVTDQDTEWKQFVNDVARSLYVKGKTKRVFVRFLGTTEDTKGHLRDMIQSFDRGVEQGNLMVYGSYNSRNMADMLVEAFSIEYIDGKLSGSRLVFVGQRRDEARVREASIKSGVTFEFYPVD